MAQAGGYVLNPWKPLTVCLRDPAVALDNNVAEREMKRQALHRGNSLFVGNPRGGRVAAILSSFASTCRRRGLAPRRDLTQLLASLPGTPASQPDPWLPDPWQQRRTPPSS